MDDIKIPSKGAPITAKSVWETAQALMHTKQPLDSKVEIEIPDVLFMTLDQGNYFIYINIEGEWKKVTNMEGEK